MLRRAAEERHEHSAGCGHQPDAQPAVQRSAVHEVLRSPGHPLDDTIRSDMESRLGADFSGVRLHTDAAAKASASEVGAHAYTSGNHVVMGEGGEDRHTLAHELTHVIQQRKGPVAGTDQGDGLAVSDPSDRFEREAEANAARVLAGPAPDRATAPPGEATAPTTATGAGTEPLQRAIDTRLGRIDGKENTVDALAPWNAHTPSFFTFSAKKWKEKWGIGAHDDAKKKEKQKELFRTLNQLIDDEEVHQAPTKDTLAELVKGLHGKAGKAPSGPGQEESEADGQSRDPDAETTLAKLKQMGNRAFPQEEMRQLANKARPGTGWLYELEAGLEQLEADPTCVVQFGACSRDDINHHLGLSLGSTERGDFIASFVSEKRSGKTGADWVVWRPAPKDADPGAAEQQPDVFTGEFVQAKLTVERNFRHNLLAAASQLEGKNASGKGNAMTDRELTLRSGQGGGARHTGTIAMQVTDDVSDPRKIENYIKEVLTKDMDKTTMKRPYVDRVVLEESMRGHRKTVYELNNGELTKTKS
ncbi:DUF4157 domain-containing protein [Streptomyces sp. NPDC059398]|uniref:eCIS core domain-containing protein n=1 Tax=Streptomyces sp. NPDC059398 TaxID=3346820 RepID=UPI00369AACA7